jgi:hypothetical protein
LYLALTITKSPHMQTVKTINNAGAAKLVKQVLEAVQDKADFTSFSIKAGADAGIPNETILATIKSQAIDNYASVAMIVGVDLLKTIMDYKYVTVKNFMQ